MSINQKVIEFKAMPGHYVAGFSEMSDCIQFVKGKEQAKKFSNEAKALAFINTYANCGYGMSKDGVFIVDANS
jgi:hypothetical protein